MSISVTESAFWILSALAAGRRHGYGIMQDVSQLSDGRTTLKVPTLYAALERLERDGLVRTAGEEIVDGRARRYFTLTESGSTALRDEASRLQARARIATERLAARPRATPAAGSAMFA